jgi:hypothetical protein
MVAPARNSQVSNCSSVSFALSRSAPLGSAPSTAARLRSAFLRSAPSRSVCTRLAYLRLASLMSASLGIEPPRLALIGKAPERSAPFSSEL